MSNLSSAVASCALNHFQTALKNTGGKPRENEEWTVYAATVCEDVSRNSLSVISCATGTKCTTQGPEGWCLRDLHAEVLTKRGVQRILWKETSQGSSGDESLLQRLKGGKWRLHPDLRLHLYISDLPCGDASIYDLPTGEVSFTGSKLLQDQNKVSAGQTVLSRASSTAKHDASDSSPSQRSCVVVREEVQLLGRLRTKSGRSNLPPHLRSCSMSCSDKIVRWCVLGLQGTALMSRLDSPIRFSSIVVSGSSSTDVRTHQQEALNRAIVDRINAAAGALREKIDPTNPYQKYFLHGLEESNLKVEVISEPGFRSSKAKASEVATETENQTDERSTTNENGKRIIKERHSSSNKRRKRPSPCGFSVAWQRGGEAEILIGSRGVKQGKKPKKESDYPRLASTLCSRRLVEGQDWKGSYREWKEQQNPEMYKIRNMVLSTEPLVGWIQSKREFSFE